VLLFIAIPAVELVLLIEVGSRIGTLTTLAVIVLTGALGALLARRQGLGVVRQVQREMGEGRVPAGSIVDGIILLVAAALLVTPGFLTDTVGFLCLVPGVRRAFKRYLWRRFERAVRHGDVTVFVGGGRD
jgi:UPF0716 protein FxsA